MEIDSLPGAPASVVTLSDDDDDAMDSKSSVVTVAMGVSQRVQKKVAPAERRVSVRLQSKEKPFYGPQKTSPSSSPDPMPKKAKKARADTVPTARLRVDKSLLVNPSCDPIDDMRASNGNCRSSSDGKREGNGMEVVLWTPTAANRGAEGLESCQGKSGYLMVKETLRLFNQHFLDFVQEEEKRCKKLEIDEGRTSGDLKHKVTNRSEAKSKKIAKAAKSQEKSANTDDTKRYTKRPDLKAISKMMETNTILYPKKRFGNLPGIEVGHQFFSRAEMVVLGFHSHWLNGIDYMGRSYSKVEEYKHYIFPVAVSIVMSGVYEDDLDNSEDIVYTGQGGNNLLGNRRQCQDQVMERGNKALKNNMEQSLPVRVVRGHESVNSYCGKVYTYDGLYKVIEYWAEKGVSGFTVYKYRLRRLEGQPVLTTNQVHFTRSQPPKSLSELRGLVDKDISGGQEVLPIPATNVVDNPYIAPSGYVYSKTVQVSESVSLPVGAPGCKCRGSCVDPRTCACARLNGGDFPYVRRDGGRLVKAKDVVFECGPNCGCGPDCINRVSQKDLKYRLEVFRTPKKGWAVRSWDSIPSGAPICEYTGIIRRTDEVDNVSGNDFIFDIDCLQTMKGLDGRERRLGDVSIHPDALDKTDDKRLEAPEYCIDAGSVGNVARFINHSCEPNLFVQCVLSSHHDIKLARVLLFAADNIPPLQELTYDYGYALDSVTGLDGAIKKMPCYCGAVGCRKRLY